MFKVDIDRQDPGLLDCEELMLATDLEGDSFARTAYTICLTLPMSKSCRVSEVATVTVVVTVTVVECGGLVSRLRTNWRKRLVNADISSLDPLVTVSKLSLSAFTTEVRETGIRSDSVRTYQITMHALYVTQYTCRYRIARPKP